MAQPKTGQNVMFSGSLRILAGAEADLVIEIARNFETEFRFTNVFLTPDSDLIEVTNFTLQNKGEKTPRELLIGDPVNIKQISNDQRLANGNFLLEALQGIEDNSEVILTVRNGEALQAVDVSYILVGTWIDDEPPADIVDRRTAFRGDGQRITTQRIEPQVGPVVQGPNGGRHQY